MRLQEHAAISIVLSGILYPLFRSWGLSLACLVSGIFIDLDHVIDYVKQCGLSFDIKKFFKVYHEDSLLKVRLLHGWEWVAFFLLAAWMTDWNPWVVGVLIGFFQHILLDTINRGESFLSYSLIWRWKKGFKGEVIFRKSHGTKREI
jgi:hypothetical protein